jgi:type IV pilus assembly protein PilW
MTLIELMVSLAITAIVLAGVVGVMRTQQQAFYGGQKVRSAQGNARTALLYLEQALSTAGYGMDPALAFDFNSYAASYGTNSDCPAQLSPCPRDSTSNADELVFYSRNPRYSVSATSQTANPAGNAWLATAMTATSLTVNAHGGETFAKGQIIQVVCAGGNRSFYATLASNLGPVTAGSQTLTLAAAVTGNPFKRQDVISTPATDACLTSATARVFLIDRYRFHVRPVSTGTGGKVTPYLMLDRGIDITAPTGGGPDGTVDASDEQVIAEGIETLQVAYTFANSGLAAVGTTAGTAITFAVGSATSTIKFGSTTVANEISTIPFPQTTSGTQTAYDPTSWFAYLAADPVRTTDSQANIRQVQLAVVARSPEPDPQHAEAFPLPVLNQSAAPAWITSYVAASGGRDGYYRVRLDATAGLPNMLGRGQMYF